MKQGTVKFSKEFVTAIGLKEWVSVEFPFDVDPLNQKAPYDALDGAKQVVEEWHKANCSEVPNTSMPPAPSTELPVINKADERLGILIDNCTTRDELLKYKDNITSPYLANIYSTKLTQLNIQAKNNV